MGQGHNGKRWVDARRVGGGWEVFTHGGRRATGIDAVEHALKLAALPADAVQSSKALLKRNAQPLTLETIATELVQFQRLLKSDECQQRIAAFFQR